MSEGEAATVFQAVRPDDAPQRMIGIADPDSRHDAVLQSMLADLFDTTPVTVVEQAATDHPTKQVVVTDASGNVLASSSLAVLQETLLGVNSDLYRTGTRTLRELKRPAILDALTDIPFVLRGYPRAHKEKLLLVLISRCIERRAWAADGGVLHVGFQYLSRLTHEAGTREVYAQLSETDVDMHVYGVPDAEVPATVSATVHGCRSDEIKRSWFVVFGPMGTDADHEAMGAISLATNEWKGLWTDEPARVRGATDYIHRTFC